MDATAHALTELTAWGLPFLWIFFAWVTRSPRPRTASACLLVAGLSSLLWDIFFIPIGPGRPAEIWRASTFVEYSDAPLGHILSVYLPLLSRLSLVAAVALLAFGRRVQAAA